MDGLGWVGRNWVGDNVGRVGSGRNGIRMEGRDESQSRMQFILEHAAHAIPLVAPCTPSRPPTTSPSVDSPTFRQPCHAYSRCMMSSRRAGLRGGGVGYVTVVVCFSLQGSSRFGIQVKGSFLLPRRRFRGRMVGFDDWRNALGRAVAQPGMARRLCSTKFVGRSVDVRNGEEMKVYHPGWLCIGFSRATPCDEAMKCAVRCGTAWAGGVLARCTVAGPNDLVMHSRLNAARRLRTEWNTSAVVANRGVIISWWPTEGYSSAGGQQRGTHQLVTNQGQLSLASEKRGQGTRFASVARGQCGI